MIIRRKQVAYCVWSIESPAFFILDDYSPLRGLKAAVREREAHIFPVKDALMYVEYSRLGTLGTRKKAFHGENYFTAENPQEDVVKIEKKLEKMGAPFTPG